MARRKSDKANDPSFEAFKKRVGERMKEVRIKNGFNSYEQFAFENDIGRAQYGKYERGTEDLRLSSLFKVLNSLDIGFAEFFAPIEKK